jgi:hypothetical protein
VCHFQGYACDISSARADCCGGLGDKGGVCQLDPLGIPRCNGLGDTCRKSGETCASSDDCCNSIPCVPDAQGQLRCGSATCQKTGDTCTINGDCCPGEVCVTLPGSITGTCGGGDGGSGGTGGTGGTGGSTSGGTGGSGGTTGGSGGTGGSTGGTGGSTSGGTGGSTGCALYGQICKASGDCCSGVPCTSGICRYAG